MCEAFFNESRKEEWTIEDKDIKDKGFDYLRKKILGLIKYIINQTKMWVAWLRDRYNVCNIQWIRVQNI